MRSPLLICALLFCAGCTRTFTCECAYHPLSPGNEERSVFTIKASRPSAENSCSAMERTAPGQYPETRVCSLQQ